MCPQSPSSHPPPPKNKQDQAEIAEFKYHYRKLSGLVAIIWGHYFHCICISVRPKLLLTVLHNPLRSPLPWLPVYYSQHERKQILKQIKGPRREHFSRFLHVDFSLFPTQHWGGVTFRCVVCVATQQLLWWTVCAISRVPEEVTQHYLNPLSLALPGQTRGLSAGLGWSQWGGRNGNMFGIQQSGRSWEGDLQPLLIKTNFCKYIHILASLQEVLGLKDEPEDPLSRSNSVVADCTQLYTLWLTLQHKRPSLEPALGLSLLGYRGNMADSNGSERRQWK